MYDSNEKYGPLCQKLYVKALGIGYMKTIKFFLKNAIFNLLVYGSQRFDYFTLGLWRL